MNKKTVFALVLLATALQSNNCSIFEKLENLKEDLFPTEINVGGIRETRESWGPEGNRRKLVEFMHPCKIGSFEECINFAIEYYEENKDATKGSIERLRLDIIKSALTHVFENAIEENELEECNRLFAQLPAGLKKYAELGLLFGFTLEEIENTLEESSQEDAPELSQTEEKLEELKK